MEIPWIASGKLTLFQYDREPSPLPGWGVTTTAGAGDAGGAGVVAGAGAVDGASADGGAGAGGV